MIFKQKKTKEEKIYEIFIVLLQKLPTYPSNISANDILHIYKRAIEIFETVDNLESIYSIEGKINAQELKI